MLPMSLLLMLVGSRRLPGPKKIALQGVQVQSLVVMTSPFLSFFFLIIFCRKQANVILAVPGENAVEGRDALPQELRVHAVAINLNASPISQPQCDKDTRSPSLLGLAPALAGLIPPIVNCGSQRSISPAGPRTLIVAYPLSIPPTLPVWLHATSVAYVSRLLSHASGLVSDCASRRYVGSSSEKEKSALLVPRYHPKGQSAPGKSATGEPAEPRPAGNLLFGM